MMVKMYVTRHLCVYVFVGHLIIVHLQSSTDVNMCYDLAEAMSNFFALACSMKRSFKLPLTGVLLLKRQHCEACCVIVSLIHCNKTHLSRSV
jgi:hypothetical protein